MMRRRGLAEGCTGAALGRRPARAALHACASAARSAASPIAAARPALTSPWMPKLDQWWPPDHNKFLSLIWSPIFSHYSFCGLFRPIIASLLFPFLHSGRGEKEREREREREWEWEKGGKWEASGDRGNILFIIFVRPWISSPWIFVDWFIYNYLNWVIYSQSVNRWFTLYFIFCTSL